MKLYSIIIKPESSFGTPLKGDTIFGHICWQAAYDDSLLKGGLKKWADCYTEKPFAVFSSAWPVFLESQKNKSWFAFKRPDLPPSMLFRDTASDKRRYMETRKDNLKKKWMKVGEDLKININEQAFLNSSDLLKACPECKSTKGGFIENFERQHNSINRLTGTTGEGFAPYSVDAFVYYPTVELAIFVLIDEEATDIKRIQDGLTRIGQSGFGRDASTGMGRFSLGEVEELPVPKPREGDALYTMSPSIPDSALCKDCLFTPFVRYGRHGDVMAKSGRPFKSPVIMADEGAVIIPKDSRLSEKPYLGKGIKGISKVNDFVTIHQGYSIYLPFKLPAGVEL
ncbi:MAG TPA: hypothetical protein VIS94_02365 [Desulfomonilia bacterium]